MSRTNKTTDVQIYWRLISYVVPYWPAFLLSVLGFSCYAASNVGFVQLMAYIVDSLGGNDVLLNTDFGNFVQGIMGDDDSLNRTIIPLGIIATVLLRGIGTFIGGFFINFIGTTLVHTLRLELFERILVLPSRYFDQTPMGHLVAKITFHVSQVAGTATGAVTVIIREGFTVVFYLGFLFMTNWKLTLIFIGVAPIIGVLINYAAKRFRRISERIQTSMGDVTQVASEAVQGYKEVRTFGGADYERQRFRAASQSNRRQSMKMTVTASITTPTVQLVVGCALAGLIWLVLDPVLLANMTPGSVVAFISVGGLLAKPIRQLTEINATIQRGLAAAKDIFDLFDQAAENDQGTETLTRVRGKIEFRSVSFCYGRSNTEAPDVLKDISFIAHPGETIALVGRSGSGKSTLASLISRFYEPQQGLILLDDVPVDQLTLANLRSHLAIVTQGVTLFNDTVANNIAYGALRSADEAAIQAAVEKAYAASFISHLDKGLDTTVGDDGVLLSGGQKQRLAIARAFLKNAPVLILDEATSALDAESERYIQAALDAVAKGRTTIVIAHRLSTIEHADRILVLDTGRIVEQGTHQELMARGQYYANLHSHRALGETKPAKRPKAPPLPAQETTSIRWLLEDILVDAWYGDARWIKLLTPLSYLYLLIASLRRARAKHWQSPVPVIVVGNITVGGTGKSPLVAWLVSRLQHKGFRPGIVSRGYGGQAKHYPLIVSATSNPLEAGDEAVMLVRRTECPVVVDPNRPRAVKQLLEQFDCDLVISDDGLQHYNLGRQYEIAVVDADRGLGNGRCLPAGPLREPASRLTEVDLVIANGLATPDLPCPHKTMQLIPTRLIHLLSQEPLTGPLSNMTVHGVAGIGRPQSFFKMLTVMGYKPIAHSFADHHNFELRDLSFGDSLPVIMTEKDAIKCRRLMPELIHDDFWYLEVEVELDESIVDAIVDKMFDGVGSCLIK